MLVLAQAYDLMMPLVTNRDERLKEFRWHLTWAPLDLAAVVLATWNRASVLRTRECFAERASTGPLVTPKKRFALKTARGSDTSRI